MLNTMVDEFSSEMHAFETYAQAGWFERRLLAGTSAERLIETIPCDSLCPPHHSHRRLRIGLMVFLTLTGSTDDRLCECTLSALLYDQY